MKFSLGKGKLEISNVFCSNKGVSLYGYRNIMWFTLDGQVSSTAYMEGNMKIWNVVPL